MTSFTDSSPSPGGDHSNGKKVLVGVGALIGVGSVITLVGLAVFFLLKPPMATDHYRYYPETTQFYMESAPGDKLTLRGVRWLDQYLKVMKNDWSQRPEFASMSKNHGLDVLNTDLVQKYHEKLEPYLEPKFSIGAWNLSVPIPSASGEASAPPKPSGNIMVMFSTKPGFSLQKFIAEFDTEGKAAPLIQKDAEKAIEYLPFPDSSPSQVQASLVSHKDHLFLLFDFTDKNAAMSRVLETAKGDQNLLKNPEFSKYMGLLDRDRQGTVLISIKGLIGTYLNEQSPLMVELSKNPQAKVVKDILQPIPEIAPVILASVKVENNEFIRQKAVMPINLDKITNEALRKDIQKLLTPPEHAMEPGSLPKSTVTYFSISNLAGIYDLILTHVPVKELKQKVEESSKPLKMVGLDLRKNLLGMLDGMTGMLMMNSEKAPELVFLLHNSADTQQTFEQLSAAATSFAQAEKTEKTMSGQHKMVILGSPSAPIPFKPAFGPVSEENIAVGTETGLTELYAAAGDKSLTLANVPLFQELTRGFPKKVSSFNYLDYPGMHKMMESLLKSAGTLPLPMPPGVSGQDPVARMQEQQKLINSMNFIAGESSYSVYENNVLQSVDVMKLMPDTAATK